MTFSNAFSYNENFQISHGILSKFFPKKPTMDVSNKHYSFCLLITQFNLLNVFLLNISKVNPENCKFFTTSSYIRYFLHSTSKSLSISKTVLPTMQLIISRHLFRLWLGVVRPQAITWTNIDPQLCHHMASLVRNELTQVWWPVHTQILQSLADFIISYPLSFQREATWFVYPLKNCHNHIGKTKSPTTLYLKHFFKWYKTHFF